MGSYPSHLPKKYEELYHYADSEDSPYSTLPFFCDTLECDSGPPVVCVYTEEDEGVLSLCLSCADDFDQVVVIPKTCDKCLSSSPTIIRHEDSKIGFSCVPCTYKLFKERQSGQQTLI